MIASLCIRLLPPWFVAALALRWWTTFDPAILAVTGVAAVVELVLWYQRAARAGVLADMASPTPKGATLERWLLDHPGPVIAVLVVFGPLWYVLRAVLGVCRFAGWLVIGPTVLVNRQRYQQAKARRQARQAQAMIEHASATAHVAAGVALRDRALEVLRQPLGLAGDHQALPRRQPPAALEVASNTRSIQLENQPPPPPPAELDSPTVRTTRNGTTELLVLGEHGEAAYEALPSGEALP